MPVWWPFGGWFGTIFRHRRCCDNMLWPYQRFGGMIVVSKSEEETNWPYHGSTSNTFYCGLLSITSFLLLMLWQTHPTYDVMLEFGLHFTVASSWSNVIRHSNPVYIWTVWHTVMASVEAISTVMQTTSCEPDHHMCSRSEEHFAMWYTNETLAHRWWALPTVIHRSHARSVQAPWCMPGWKTHRHQRSCWAADVITTCQYCKTWSTNVKQHVSNKPGHDHDGIKKNVHATWYKMFANLYW